MKKTALVFGLLISLQALAFSSRAITVADSFTDFSSTQGQANWYYGYATSFTPYTSSDFIQLPLFDSTLPVNLDESQPPPYTEPGWFRDGTTWLNSSYWTFLGRSLVKPSGSAMGNGQTAVDEWTIRRWVSEVSGEVRVTGDTSKINSFGNGYILNIFAGNSLIFSQATDPTIPIHFDFSVNLIAGESLDFAVDARDHDNGSDNILFRAILDAAPKSTPDAASTGGLMGASLACVAIFSLATSRRRA